MKSENSELTLAIIKPDAVDKVEEIKTTIEDKGFKVWQERKFVLSLNEASEFYSDHRDQPYYDELIEYMTGGPITALVLSGDDVIDRWNLMIGPVNVITAKAEQPDSLRAIYGSSEYRNAIHGSRDVISAQREIQFMFPELEIQTATGQEAKIYLEENVNPMLLKGLTELCRTKPEDPIVWLADWLLVNNTNKSNRSTTMDNVDD